MSHIQPGLLYQLIFWISFLLYQRCRIFVKNVYTHLKQILLKKNYILEYKLGSKNKYVKIAISRAFSKILVKSARIFRCSKIYIYTSLLMLTLYVHAYVNPLPLTLQKYHRNWGLRNTSFSTVVQKIIHWELSRLNHLYNSTCPTHHTGSLY